MLLILALKKSNQMYLYSTPTTQATPKIQTLPQSEFLIITLIEKGNIRFQLRTDKLVKEFNDNILHIYHQKIQLELRKNQSAS